MTKSKHDLANVTILILVDFDKKIAIFDLDFKIVTALLVMVMGREPPILTSNIGKITALPMFSNVGCCLLYQHSMSCNSSRDVNGTRFFLGSRKNKIPERENFRKLRAVHHYKMPWQQCVSQRTQPDARWSQCHFVHNTGRCLLIDVTSW